jgi:hypothetical protein
MDDAVEWQHHVPNPIDQRQNRDPVAVGIIWAGLLCESLKRSQQSRAHQRCKARPGQMGIRMSLAEAVNGRSEKQPRKRRHDYVACPVGQVQQSVFKHGSPPITAFT